MRKKKNLLPRLAAVSDLITETPQELAGRWRSYGGNREYSSLRVELGCGMGRFAALSAQSCPDVMFVAVERVPEALVVAAEKAAAAKLENLCFVGADAGLLDTWFSPGEVDRLYVQFCDPWHKKKQAKRRLTHRSFLRSYAQILSERGELWFKSDNSGLLEFTKEELTESGWELAFVSDDWLHDPARTQDDIMTEYEMKFADRMQPVGRIVARPPAR